SWRGSSQGLPPKGTWTGRPTACGQGGGPARLEQTPNQAASEHAGGAAAVVTGREGGFHRHDLLTHQLLEPLEHAIVEPPAAQLARSLEQYRAWVGAGDGHAQVGERVTIPAQRRGDAGNRILNRTADADLIVARAQARLKARVHTNDEFAWTESEIALAVAPAILTRVADVELLQRERAAAGGTDEIDLGAES